MTRARPVRLQLSRKKGFRLQALSLAKNGLPAVNVARPGRHGNPHAVADIEPDGAPGGAKAIAVRFFAEDILDGKIVPDIDALRGKNLACWCAPGSACHADVLLEIANEDKP